MRKRGRAMPIILAILLLIGVQPMTAFAAETLTWAEDAAAVLNDVYGDGIFTADDADATVGDMKTLLENTFDYPADNEIITTLSGADSVTLTKLQLAQVVCNLYGIEEASSEDMEANQFADCSDPYAVALRMLGVVNGAGERYFYPDDPVNNAALAVVFYRTLNEVGGGNGTVIDDMVPGHYGYDDYLYMVVRQCIPVPSSVAPDDTLTSETVLSGDDIYETGKDAILYYWEETLEDLAEEEDRDSWPENDSVGTLLDAAIAFAEADRAAIEDKTGEDVAAVFSDVWPDSYYYDGIMYLLNNNISSGYGDGTFRPDTELTRDMMAAFLCRVKGINTDSPADGVTVTDMDDSYWSYNAVTHALAEGYMIYTDGTDFSPDDTVSRQEAALAIFGCYGGYNAKDVNLDVLDRFSDGGDVGTDYQRAVAYLVSAGIISGTEEGEVLPDTEINRAMFGVLLARCMSGLDTSKMHDYETAVEEALS